MMVSEDLLTLMVVIALAVTSAAPVLLIAFLIRDWRNGKLW